MGVIEKSTRDPDNLDAVVDSYEREVRELATEAGLVRAKTRQKYHRIINELANGQEQVAALLDEIKAARADQRRDTVALLQNLSEACARLQHTVGHLRKTIEQT